MGTRTKNQIVLKKQKCGGFLFKIFEHESLIRSTNVALAGNYRIPAILSDIYNQKQKITLKTTENEI